MNIETTLLAVREVQVFRIPPRQSSRGYRASDWDPSAHLWSGRLKVVSAGSACFIRLEDSATGQLFAQCNYDDSGAAVESVVDSSRYFVIRLEDQLTGRHAFVGLGFLERNEAFDFNVALQDHAKHLKREQDRQSQPLQTGTKVDYSLKDGASIQINIGGLSKRSNNGKSGEITQSNNMNGDLMGLSLPPPNIPSSYQSNQTFLPAPPAYSNSAQQPQQPKQAPNGWVQF